MLGAFQLTRHLGTIKEGERDLGPVFDDFRVTSPEPNLGMYLVYTYHVLCVRVRCSLASMRLLYRME